MKKDMTYTIELDSVDPDSEALTKLLKKYDVTMQIMKRYPHGVNGWTEVKLTGAREGLSAILTSEDGWGDGNLITFAS